MKKAAAKKKPVVDIDGIPVHCAHDAVVAVKSLKPNPRNPNTHPDEQIRLLAKIIATQGWRCPITVSDRSGYIVRGHARLLAAKAAGFKRVPVDRQSYASEADEWADLVADNRLAELAEMDMPELKDLLQELDTGELDMELTGWTEEAMADLMSQVHPNGEVEEDEAPGPLKEAVSHTGDIWLCGEHRVMCGDSTSKEDVGRLMGGEKFGICFTSPPYADLRDYELGDFNWITLMKGIWDVLIVGAAEDSHILVNLGPVHRERAVWNYWEDWLTYAADGGWPLFGQYVWDKGSGMPGNHQGRLASSHEYIFHFNRVRKPANKWIKTSEDSIRRGSSGKRFRQRDGTLKECGSPTRVGQPFRIPDSVIRITAEKARGIHTENHPAVYPVELPAFGMKTWSSERGFCYDPFLGSGTTMIAAEQLNRRCYGMEIAPQYVDVSVRRWQNLTEKEATLEETGQTFAEVAEERGVEIDG